MTPVGLPDEVYARLLMLRTDLRRFERWSAERAQSAGLTPMQVSTIQLPLTWCCPIVDVVARGELRVEDAIEKVSATWQFGMAISLSRTAC